MASRAISLYFSLAEWRLCAGAIHLVVENKDVDDERGRKKRKVNLKQAVFTRRVGIGKSQAAHRYTLEKTQYGNSINPYTLLKSFRWCCIFLLLFLFSILVASKNSFTEPTIS